MDVLASALLVASVATLAAALGVASATDLSCRVIPNGCALAVACSGMVRSLGCGGGSGNGAPSPAEAVAGGAVVAAVMLLAAALSARRGGSVGVGGGDVKLLTAVGVWTGPAAGLVAVFLSCLVGVAGWAVSRALGRAAGRGVAVTGGLSPPGRGRLSEGIPLAPAISATALVMVLSGLLIVP